MFRDRKMGGMDGGVKSVHLRFLNQQGDRWGWGKGGGPQTGDMNSLILLVKKNQSISQFIVWNT